MFSFILGGLLIVAPSMVLELIGEEVLSACNIKNVFNYNFFIYFLIVPITEESLKYMAMRVSQLKLKSQDIYVFETIVQSITISLSFALLENIFYCYSLNDFRIMLIRGITSVPLHCITGLYMGHFYGLSRYYDYKRRPGKKFIYNIIALLSPILIHGSYDLLVSGSSSYEKIATIFYLLLLDIYAIHSTLKYCVKDRRYILIDSKRVVK